MCVTVKIKGGWAVQPSWLNINSIITWGQRKVFSFGSCQTKYMMARDKRGEKKKIKGMRTTEMQAAFSLTVQGSF